MNRDELERLDARGYVVVDAVTYVVRDYESSLANPRAFVCADGITYWLKSSAQQGLAAELIAGRLAARVSMGPIARIIRVAQEALPPDGTADHLQGLVVGSMDVKDSVNGRELHKFLPPGGSFDPRKVDAASRAGVVVFQTWIGASDSQVLVELTTGRIHSIDHGDCFGSLASPEPLEVVVTDIPGIPADIGRTKKLVLPALERIEAVTDAYIIEALAGLPSALRGRGAQRQSGRRARRLPLRRSGGWRAAGADGD
jgi:hypothetical protein